MPSWSDEFNGPMLDTGAWNEVNGDGCQVNLGGYGNAELEYYSPGNLSIVKVPFEPGTHALAIRAQRQTSGTKLFTSGKIDSLGKVQVQYGMIEIRMATPEAGTGLWPAASMLGVSSQAWPRKGEIDIMEMGIKVSARAARIRCRSIPLRYKRLFIYCSIWRSAATAPMRLSQRR